MRTAIPDLVSAPTIVQGKCCKSLGICICSLGLIGLCTHLWICHCCWWKGDMASTNLELSLKLEVVQSHPSHVAKNEGESSSSRGRQNIVSRNGGMDDGAGVNNTLCKWAGRRSLCVVFSFNWKIYNFNWRRGSIWKCGHWWDWKEGRNPIEKGNTILVKVNIKLLEQSAPK